MCGLAAIIDPYLVDREKDAFWTLLLATSLRGIDSTGIFSVDTKYNMRADDPSQTRMVRWAKALGDPFRLRAKPEFNRILKPLNEYGTRALVGHCRAATRGHMTPENAHPFDVGDIIGVHNGTIRSGLKIPDGETDSEALFELIQEKGIEGLKDVDGAFALIWYDRRTHKIHALRNNERPLFYREFNSNIVLASEKSFIEFTCTRHADTFKGEGEITELPAYHLLTCDLKELRLRQTRIHPSNLVIEDRTEDVKRAVVTVNYVSRFRYAGGWYGEDDIPWDEVVKKAEKEAKETGSTEQSSDIPVVQGVKEAKDSSGLFPCFPIGGGVYVSRKRYTELLKCGCQWCTSPGVETDPVVWGEETELETNGFRYDQFLCEQCVANDPGTASTWANFDVNAALVDSKRNVERLVH